MFEISLEVLAFVAFLVVVSIYSAKRMSPNPDAEGQDGYGTERDGPAEDE